MKRTFLAVTITLAGLLLAGCASGAPAAVTPAPTRPVAPSLVPTPTPSALPKPAVLLYTMDSRGYVDPCG